MKIAFVHLSDIHIQSVHDFVIPKCDKLVAACKTVTNDCDKVVIIVSGDIAGTGKSSEYDVAFNYLKKIESGLKQENASLGEIEFVITPGNHDCVFVDDSIRDLVIEDLSKVDECSDSKKIEIALSVQDNFWSFYSKLCGSIPESKVSYSKNISLDDETRLEFLCYNTALISKLKENVGNLIVPKNSFINPSTGINTIPITIFHHNTGWLSPNTPKNNKKLFEQHVVATSQFVFCGHEHDEVTSIESKIGGNSDLVYCEGAALQESSTVSKFNIIVFDSDAYKVSRHSFEYKDVNYDPQLSRYVDTPSDEETIRKKSIGIGLNPEYDGYLNRLIAPLRHPKKKEISLTDIFVFPDLEIIQDIDIDSTELIDSQLLLKQQEYDVIIIQGEAQSGRSSLLHKLYMEYVSKGIFPLLINGKDIKSANIIDLTKKAYKEQYNQKQYAFDSYEQLEKSRKIILVDDLSSSDLRGKDIEDLFKRLLRQYSYVIVTADDNVEVGPIGELSKDYTQIKYKISPFGSVKRNELVKKWINLGWEDAGNQISDLERQIRLTFDQLNNLLGEQFLPAYPFYLLSLLQSLNEALRPFETEQSYYAYCYNSILIASLNSVGLTPDIQKEFLNFLKYLAYFMFQREDAENKRRISYKELESAFNYYSTKFIFTTSLEKTLQLLAEANLFVVDPDTGLYKFTYKYLYFYLVAQELAHNVSTPEGKAIVENLCDESYKEEPANILLFLVYHTENTDVVEQLVFTSMLPFESYTPATLDRNDNIFTHLNSLISKVETKELIADTNPEEERQKALEKRDKVSRVASKHRLSKKDLDELEKNPDIRDLNKAIRAIKILGQIVKNQKANLNKDLLNDLIKETYFASFRLISFYGNLVEKGEKEFKETLEQELPQDATRTQIQEAASQMFMSLLYRFSLQVFSNLSISVGTQKANDLYERVADEIGTPAAKLITFTIKSYYGPMDIQELQTLVKEFDGNPMAMHILRARVIKYLYTNTVNIQKKQQLTSICQLKMIPSGKTS